MFWGRSFNGTEPREERIDDLVEAGQLGDGALLAQPFFDETVPLAILLVFEQARYRPQRAQVILAGIEEAATTCFQFFDEFAGSLSRRYGAHTHDRQTAEREVVINA